VYLSIRIRRSIMQHKQRSTRIFPLSSPPKSASHQIPLANESCAHEPAIYTVPPLTSSSTSPPRRSPATAGRWSWGEAGFWCTLCCRALWRPGGGERDATISVVALIGRNFQEEKVFGSGGAGKHTPIRTILTLHDGSQTIPKLRTILPLLLYRLLPALVRPPKHRPPLRLSPTRRTLGLPRLNRRPPRLIKWNSE
jgi:hypothetical protein